TLSEVVRQREKWTREAGKSQRQGKSEEALQAFAERGCLVIEKDTEKALDALVTRYFELAGPALEKIVVSGSNAAVRRVNSEIQRRRRASQEISSEAIEVGDYRFHEGDRVLFLRNHAPLGISNGDLGEV